MDQLYLWEMETGKMSFKEGVLYSNFLSHSQFEFLHQFASSLGPSTAKIAPDQSEERESTGGVLYSNPSRRMMIVDECSHEPVKKHWKANKSRFES